MLSVPSETHALGYFYFVLTLTSLPLVDIDGDCMLSHAVTVPVVHKFLHHNVWPIIFLPLFLKPIGLWMLLFKHHWVPIILPFRPTIVQPTTSSITTMVFRMFSKSADSAPPSPMSMGLRVSKMLHIDRGKGRNLIAPLIHIANHFLFLTTYICYPHDYYINYSYELVLICHLYG